MCVSALLPHGNPFPQDKISKTGCTWSGSEEQYQSIHSQCESQIMTYYQQGHDLQDGACRSLLTAASVPELKNLETTYYCPASTVRTFGVRCLFDASLPLLRLQIGQSFYLGSKLQHQGD